MKKIKIGSLEINSYVYIPPMAGITDLAFRKIIRLFDKESLIATEMISSKALMFKEDQTRMNLSPDEHPVGIQIFGHETLAMEKAAILAEKQGADFIDINMGCPVPKITKGKDGAALMREPDLAVKIAEAVVHAVQIPVTVKMRLGWNECEKNAPDLARRLEQVGICAFTIHGRTREQGYSGIIDLEGIKKVKKIVSVPVFGNGDIRTPEDAQRLLEVTGCDGVGIARALLGSPWFSAQVNEYLSTGSYKPSPPLVQRIEIVRKHLDELILLKGEDKGIRDGKKHLISYFKGMPDAAKLRAEVGKIKTMEEAKKLLLLLKETEMVPSH